jgi:hypothetical protein
MKTTLKLCLMLLTLHTAVTLGHAQGTAFTYNGRLNDNGAPANGNYDITFTWHDAENAGAQVGGAILMSSVPVANGLFAVTLDFGAGVFTGPARWLEVAVRPTGTPDFTTLVPRQGLTSSPYAIYASTAAAVATEGVDALAIKDASVSAAKIAAGQVVKSLNGLSDVVTLAAGANVTITTNGNTLTLAAAGAGGSGIWSANGNNAYYNAGNVGIGTTTPVAQLQAETGEVKPAVYGHATGAGTGVQGESSTGIGVYASSSSGNGVYATSATASGVEGHSGTGIGVYASSIGGRGVYATSDSGAGVESHSTSGFGVYGASTSASGVEGHSTSGFGVYGASTSAAGVEGHSSSGSGVYGGSTSGFGVFGESSGAGLSGVYGISHSSSGSGVVGETYVGSLYGTPKGAGVTGIAHVGGTSIHGIAVDGAGEAGFFDGDVDITTDLHVSGTKNFKIDHPLDPTNRYLVHASIESPDVKNLYDGNITTDANGDAAVTLPTYFEALNRDFRYQLTAIGQFAQAIVSSKIKGNQFTIKTDKPNVEVSWQVTGIRQDAYMKAHPMVVEQDKPANERGTYQHPELFGQPEEKGLSWSQNPELWKRLKKERVEQAALPKP